MLLWLACDRCALLPPCAWAIWRSTRRPDDRYSSSVATRQVSTNRWWKMLAKSQKWVKTFWKTSVVPRQLEFRAWGTNVFCVNTVRGGLPNNTTLDAQFWSTFWRYCFTIVVLYFCCQFFFLLVCVCFRSLEVNGGPPPNIYSSSRASEYLDRRCRRLVLSGVCMLCSCHWFAVRCCAVEIDKLFITCRVESVSINLILSVA